MKHILGLLFLLSLSLPSVAVIEIYEFATDTQKQRYHHLIEELRCPKCQNQNLAESDAPIAQDLRRELHRLLSEGRSDEAIIEYMVVRYGNFVLYRPPLDKNTLILWAAPGLFLLFGLIIAWRVRVTNREGAKEENKLSLAEKQEIADLINQYGRK